MMYAILCTDGQMNAHAIINECRPEKWVPIFAYYDAKIGEQPQIPLFHDPKTAKNFARRNLPSEWLKGAVFVLAENISWMENKGWQMQPMSFPRLMKDLPGIKFGFEIMEFIEKPEIYAHVGAVK